MCGYCALKASYHVRSFRDDSIQRPACHTHLTNAVDNITHDGNAAVIVQIIGWTPERRRK